MKLHQNKKQLLISHRISKIKSRHLLLSQYKAILIHVLEKILGHFPSCIGSFLLFIHCLISIFDHISPTFVIYLLFVHSFAYMFDNSFMSHTSSRDYSSHVSLVDAMVTPEYRSLEALWWVEPDTLLLGAPLGEGAFSKVHSARLKWKNWQIPVAVKTVKG